MESGKDLNYWPGFVDALSNVVLTLVFVLVVFVFALVMASSKVEQKVVELAEQAQQRDSQKLQTQEELQELRQDLREALEHLQAAESERDKLREQVAELKKQQVPGSEERNALKEKVQIQVEAPPREGNKIDEAELDTGTGAIVVVFPRGIFELNDKVRAELDKSLLPQKAALNGLTASVKTIMGVETYSEARRLAYYRAMTVRNYLIEKGLGKGRTINITIEQSKEITDGRVEIRFTRR